MCALNEHEIIILGGLDLDDGYLLDTRTDTLREVIEPYENSPKLYSKYNQSYMICENTVIANAMC